MSSVRKFLSLTLGVLLACGPSSLAWATLEQQQVEMEGNLQNRIENLLSKTLPANSYIVSVKVELAEKTQNRQVVTRTGGRKGANPFLGQDRFILPGVPEKKEFRDTKAEPETSTTVDTGAVESQVKKIMINIMVAPDITDDEVKSMRELLNASLPFNPLRGDEMVIQTSNLLKPAHVVESKRSNDDGRGFVSRAGEGGGTSSSSHTNVLVIALLGVIAGGLFILVMFLFGPVRIFFNRLLTVLPRVGEQGAFSGANPSASTPNGQPQMTLSPSGDRGILASSMGGHSGNGKNSGMPFDFIHEEQLNKLPILFKDFTPAQIALVLAYLPPMWASRVLADLPSETQTGVMRELSQTREIPSVVVKEIEMQLKEKLPYLVGGTEWIQSVYQMTQPQMQKTILGSLSQQSPELANTLRKKTFFFEDLSLLDSPSMRALVQDIGYPILALSLKDEKQEFRNSVLQRLPAGIRDIVQQELELSTEDKPAINDAKTRLSVAARRLVLEGRIVLPERKK